MEPPSTPSLLTLAMSALVAIGAFLGRRSEAPAAAAHQTLLPPAPAASSAAFATVAEVEQLRRELAEVRAAQAAADKSAGRFRTRVLVRLARIFDRLKIREEPAAEEGGDRGSET